MYSAGFELNPVKDVPADVQKQAAGLSLELQQEELKEAQSLDKTIEELSAEYQRALHDIVGDENLERYFEFRQSLSQQIRETSAKQAPTIVGEQEVQEASQAAADKSRDFLKKIGFDMASASKLRGEYHTRMNEVLSKAIGSQTEPNYLVQPEMVPKDIYNPWVVFGPPYPGWNWSYSWNRSDEPSNPSFARYLNSASGSLGTFTYNHVSGADDSDFSYVRYRTAMRFWYRMPAAGLADVWMKMQCISTPYSGRLRDEWGWSDSSCDQEHHVYLQVINPGPSAMRKGTILDYRRTGTDATWSNVVCVAGTERWAHLFSADAYAVGQWLLLEVGTEEWNHFWSNDVSINSSMTMRWFLENVYVRSSGE